MADSSPIATPSATPWAQILRGESEFIAVSPPPSMAAAAAIKSVVASSSASSPSSVVEEDSPDNGTVNGGPNSNMGRRAAWDKPFNGTTSPKMIGVMGAESWPALSESTRAPSKPIPDLIKGLSDGSSSVSSAAQGSATVSSATPNLRQGSDNANTNSSTNHAVPSHQRSMKRNGANTSANGGTQPPGPQGPAGEAYSNNSSPRDYAQRSSQSRGVNVHTQQQRSFRSRGGGRGDGSQHHNFGGRRDHDRANHDWNNRNFNSRDAHMQSQRGVPRFVRHPPPSPSPASPPFIVPPPLRAFGPPIGYPEFSMYYFSPPPDSLRGMPLYTAPVSPVFLPATDLQLHSKIVNQIDYYFSDENLIKDTFLRQNMDDQGWVPVKLIAGFKKVLYLTDNIQLILDALRSSTVVEVQGDRVRKQIDWNRWIMPPSVRFPNAAGPGNSSPEMLADSMQNASLEENTIDRNAWIQADTHSEEFTGRSSSGDLPNQSIKEEMGPVNSTGDFNHSSAARNSS